MNNILVQILILLILLGCTKHRVPSSGRLLQDRVSGSIKIISPSGEKFLYSSKSYDSIKARWDSGVVEAVEKRIFLGDKFWIRKGSSVIDMKLVNCEYVSSEISLKSTALNQTFVAREEQDLIISTIRLRWSFADNGSIYIYYDSVIDGVAEFELGLVDPNGGGGVIFKETPFDR